MTVYNPIALTQVEDVTRRQFMSSALAAALLIACGGDDADDEAAAQPATREVSDIFGTLSVPTQPQRVLLLGQQVAANAVFLGQPVEHIAGIAWGGNELPPISYLPHQNELSRVPNLGSVTEPDLEAIARLTPDLIVNFGFNDDATRTRRDRYALTGVPVFTVYNGYATFDETMRFLRDIGAALNLEAKAAAEEAKLRTALDVIRKRYVGRQLPSVSTIRPFPNGQFWANGSAILEGLGVPGPRPTAQQPSMQYSEERLSDLEADFIVVYALAGDSAEVARQRMEASPVWRSLRAVAEGRVRYVEPVAWLNWNVPALYLGLKDVDAMLGG